MFDQYFEQLLYQVPSLAIFSIVLMKILSMVFKHIQETNKVMSKVLLTLSADIKANTAVIALLVRFFENDDLKENK